MSPASGCAELDARGSPRCCLAAAASPKKCREGEKHHLEQSSEKSAAFCMWFRTRNVLFMGLDITEALWPPVGDLVKSRRAAPGVPSPRGEGGGEHIDPQLQESSLHLLRGCS